MSNSKHTPGPWTVDNFGSPVIFAGEMHICDIRGRGYLTGKGARNLPEKEAVEIQEANADRIVACVNALEGIEDPAAARTFIDEVVLLLKYLVEIGRLPQDSPTVYRMEEFVMRIEGEKKS